MVQLQGKEFERSNEIVALASSDDALTAGMQSAIASCINLNCWPARSRAHDQSDPRFASEYRSVGVRTPSWPNQTPFPLLEGGVWARD